MGKRIYSKARWSQHEFAAQFNRIKKTLKKTIAHDVSTQFKQNHLYNFDQLSWVEVIEYR